MKRPLFLLLPFLLSGCIARTAMDVAAMPLRAAGKAVDLATTSAQEAAAAANRAERRRDEKLEALERAYARHAEQCRNGDSTACDRRDATYAEIERISPAPRPVPD